MPQEKEIEVDECDGCETTPEKEAGEAPEIPVFEADESGDGGAKIPEPVVNVEPNPGTDFCFEDMQFNYLPQNGSLTSFSHKIYQTWCPGDHPIFF